MATRSADGRDDARDGRTGRQAVFEDLFEFLASARSGAHPDRMAAALLRRTVGQTSLVALVDDGRRAVLHDGRDGTLVSVPFDEHGLVDADADPLRTDADPDEWVAADGAAAAWVHPRYRSAGDDAESDDSPRPE